MDKNKFHIIKYRLKIGNPNILLVQGWFENNEMEACKVCVLLDNQRLVYKISTKEGIQIRKKHFADTGIDKEYYFWIPLPEHRKEHTLIRVFEIYNEKEKLLCAIPCKKIEKMVSKLEKYIETVEKKDKEIIISGWYISKSKVKIIVLGEKEQNISFKLEENFRPDVILEYPEVNGNDVHGFKIIFSQVPDKSVDVLMSDGEKKARYTCEINPGKWKVIASKTRKTCEKTVAYFHNNGLRNTVKRASEKVFGLDTVTYSNWMKKNQITLEELLRQKQATFEIMPKFSIVVPLYNTPMMYLDELIESVKNQSYANWELCLSDGSGVNSSLADCLEQYKKEDARIRVINNQVQLKISDNTNKAMEIAEGDYIVFVDHDDVLTPDAMYECAKAINENPQIDAMYSDEDKISMNGKEYFEPHFKTDFNIDLLCSMNYICHLFIISRKIVEKIGMLNSNYEGAQDYDFILRSVEKANCVHHISKVLYHWRAHKDSTAENPESKLYAFESGSKAVQAHYDRVGIQARVHQGEFYGLYKTEHIIETEPLISILIPNKDHIEDLDKCIKSIEKKSIYKNYEFIIIENNSEEKSTFDYYKQLESVGKKFSIVYYSGEFNYSAINNFGAQYAKGEYLLLLNNDTEIINDTCIAELVGYCMHENVGAVGARLYYEDNTIQHAGVIVGFGGIAGHAFIGLSRASNGYFSRIICAQDLSAVTAACMLVKKEVFEKVGGFDEELKVAFNDIDLCMKIRNAGFLIVYNPYAELYHYESKSRGMENTKEKVERFNSEIAKFSQKWPEILKKGDPYYNPNLSMDKCDFSLK